MVIAKTAQNKEGASGSQFFIRCLKINKQNTEFVGYATPNDALDNCCLKD